MIEVHGPYPPALIKLPSGGLIACAGNGQIKVPPGTTLIDLDWKCSGLRDLPQEELVYWETIILSSSHSEEYRVRFDNGVWVCECVGYHYRHSCRHIAEALREMEKELAT